MAVLNKIRQRSVFLIIIIALALFAFVLADVIRNGGAGTQQSQNTIATVNDEDIDREQFARQVEAYQRNLGPQASTSQAVNRVWESNIREIILDEQFEELGIRVEESQVRALLGEQMANNPNFTNEAGMFDVNRLREYVATLRSTSPEAYRQWLDFENSVGKSAREKIYFNMIKAGLGATSIEGEQAYRLSNDKADIKYVEIPYASIPDSEVNVSKSDIKKYIEKNPKRFQTEASRDIQYVFFEEEASEEDEGETRENITALLEDREEFNAVTSSNETVQGFGNTKNVASFVNENSDENYADNFQFKDDLPAKYADDLFNLQPGETYGPYKDAGAWKVSRMMEVAQIPDSVKASHVLVTYRGTQISEGVTRSKGDAKSLADSIASVVKRNNSKFADLAAQYSADTSNKDNAGELGWFAPGAFIPAFNDYVFTNNKGDIGVVETEYGFHVIHIEDQTQKEKAVKLATIVRNLEASEKSMNDLFTEVTRFEIAAGKGDFSQIAKENDKEVRPVREISELDENIPGVGSQRRIVQWAFEDDTEAGDVKRFEIRGGYVVAQLTAVNEKGLRSVEAASSTVLPILQKQKKAEIIKKKISGNSLEEIAREQGVAVENAGSLSLDNPNIPGAGNEPEVVGAAFALEPGKISKPVAGNKGVFVVELGQKREAANLDSYRSYAGRETANRRQVAEEEVFSALKNKAEIEDNRSKFY